MIPGAWPGVANILGNSWKVMVGLVPLLAGKGGFSDAGGTLASKGAEKPPGGEPPQRAGGQPLGSKAQPRRAEGKEWPG